MTSCNILKHTSFLYCVPLAVASKSKRSIQRHCHGQVTHIGRGRHTTRHVALLEVGGGLLADSPGFNQPSLADLTPSELPDCFPEIRERLDR